ncbi:hypothetical protein ACO0SA_003752 [Hanseniaspora valbyensis]
MSKAPDMSNISAVLFDKECKIKYTSFNDTQDISSTFLNIDKNALSTYIALYSYATTNESNNDGNESTISNTKNSNGNNNNNSSNNHGEDRKDREERKNPIITASLKNKRKLLLTKVRDTYFTILIKESLKYYQLELLRKGMRWVCNLISVDETIRLDTAMSFLSQMDNVFGYYHLLEDNNINDDITFYSKNVFVYDLDRKGVVLENNALATNFSNDALADWIYYIFKILKDKKRKEEEANNLDMGKGGLNDNFIVNNLKLPFKFTYDVINEIVGTAENSTTSNINLYTSLSEERETQNNGNEKYYPNTHFLKEKNFTIENKNVLIWEYDSFIGILRDGDDGELEYTILQEEEEKLLNLVKEYESVKFKQEEKGTYNFHYIIQSLEKEEPIHPPPTSSSSITSLWFPHLNIASWSTNNQLKKDDNDKDYNSKSTALINNLSEKEYEKLLNHLLTITSREKLSIKKAVEGELAEERLIKLKDYDLVIYITFVKNKFILVVKDFPLEKPDTLTQQQNEVEKGLNNLYLLGSEATNFISSKII